VALDGVEKKEDWFKGTYLELSGFYTHADKLANSVVVGNMSDKILQPSNTLNSVEVVEGHSTEVLGAENNCPSNVTVNAHLVKGGAFDGDLDCFALVN
jgi:hypothetical protein